MRSSCVHSARGGSAARAVLMLVLTALVLATIAVPEAQARRRRHHASGGGYSPPFASMVYDVNAGRVLQSTHGDALRHPASVTKVMTLYLLFEQLEAGRLKLTSEMRVSREAASQAPSKLGLKPGETIAVEDAIKALVTKSANDVAVVIAEAIGGNQERFAKMMTAKARALGMRNSTFYNASGLPHPRQFVTARDLVTLGKAIQDRFPKYYTYFGTRNFAYNGRAYRNHNRLLGRIEGVDGIKTGYTRASGFNLLTSAKADGRHLITVVLGGRSARIRDQQVASLLEDNMDSAYAGRRRSAKTVEVATADIADNEDEGDANDLPAAAKPAAAKPAAAKPAAAKTADATSAGAPLGLISAANGLPRPPSRPRTAVIAETGERFADSRNAETRNPAGSNPGLTRGRPLALAASGSTGMVAATTPLAMVATTPRSPAMRWVEGPRAAQVRSQERLLPPGNVRFTNAIPAQKPVAEPDQALPVAQAASEKIEARLPSMKEREDIARETPAPKPEVTSKDKGTSKDTVRIEVSQKGSAPSKQAEAAAAIDAARLQRLAPTRVAAVSPKAVIAPRRSGWMIQLAATDNEAKAQEILDNAKGKVSLLNKAEPYTEAVTKGESTLHRARFAGFDQDAAQAACKAAKRAGFKCYAAKI